MVARSGQPNLTNDPGKKQGWKHRTLRNLEEKKERVVYNFRASESFMPLLAKAAATRKMTRTAYMRRAIGAFIANDLHMPYSEVCATYPAVENNLRAEVFINGKSYTRRDDGEGYGSWEVK